MSDDNIIQEFLEEHEQKKGEYDKEQYQALVKLVKELETYLANDEGDAILIAGRRLESAGKSLQQHGDNVWTRYKTAEILTEVAQQESSIQKESA
jgi:hypothetical protein